MRLASFFSLSLFFVAASGVGPASAQTSTAYAKQVRTPELAIQQPIGTLGLFASSTSESASDRSRRLAVWTTAQKTLVAALDALGVAFVGATAYHEMTPTLRYPSAALDYTATLTSAIPPGTNGSSTRANLAAATFSLIPDDEKDLGAEIFEMVSDFERFAHWARATGRRGPAD